MNPAATRFPGIRPNWISLSSVPRLLPTLFAASTIDAPRYCYFCSLILGGKLSIDVTMMYLFNTNKIIYCDTSPLGIYIIDSQTH
jgi:hypothetical protein